MDEEEYALEHLEALMHQVNAIIYALDNTEDMILAEVAAVALLRMSNLNEKPEHKKQ
jgi:hypothetical protein